jgi:hypothetical protein
MLDRLPEVLSGATTFVDACADAAASAGRDLEAEEVDEDTLVEEYGADVAGDLPEAEGAWQSAPGLCLGVIGMLSRSPAGRARARADAALLEAAGDVGRLVGPAAFLVKMLQVLDDEELVVLDPGGKRGWRTVFSGVADNFQLHTLLAAALVGPADEGLLPGPVGSSLDETEAVPGRRLDPRIAGIARDLPCPPHNQPTVSSHLNLWTWRGLQADGTLPVNALGASDHWVWNEGVPADIPPFEGKRVVLLGTAPFSRSWNAGRVFDGMTADFRVVETLTPEASAAWLGRIAAAAGGG